MRCVELHFAPLVGGLKSMGVSEEEFKHIAKFGKGIDGSSVYLVSIEKSDLLLMPVRETLYTLPWSGSACVLCDIYRPAERIEEFGKEKECELSPRFVLKRELANLARMGYDFRTSVEMEYFLLTNEASEPSTKCLVDDVGYLSPTPRDRGARFRRELVKTLYDVGIRTAYEHHEVSPGQYEVCLTDEPALITADNVMRFRYIAANLAAQRGYVFTPMPKPFVGMNGSGMHIHMSLFKGKRNLFFGKEERISGLARNFIGGLLEHSKALAAFAAPSINSYKRLVAGYEAPVYVAWGHMNRSTLIRIPAFSTQRTARVELRTPDPTCNPYLTQAAMLVAGMDGIERELDPGEPSSLNVYNENEGLDTLPPTLAAAIEELKKDKVLTQRIGRQAIEHYARLKLKEWEDFRRENDWKLDEITPWEYRRYLNFV
jgi:glutamine synthetase